MRILQVHNFYRESAPSGENRVVEQEEALLRGAGHDVRQFARSNDEFSRQPGPTALAMLVHQSWNKAAAQKLRNEILEWKPDVVHIHNTFPLISAAAFHVTAQSTAACVWTVHNYRPWCASADFFRAGRMCELCLEKPSGWPAINHRCYRESALMTLPVVLANRKHKSLGTYSKCPDRIIALSEFQRKRLIAFGLDPEKVIRRAHGVAEVEIVPWSARETRIVFAGRLSEEKGVKTLVNAYTSHPELHSLGLILIGDGPLRKWCLEKARDCPSLRLLGAVSPIRCRLEIGKSRLLVTPSEWPETFGLSIIEAFASSVPVLAADIAGLSELVQAGKNGEMFPPGDVEKLAEKLINMTRVDHQLELLGQAALATYQESFSERKSVESLETIYAAARQRAQTDRAAQ